MLTQQLNKHVMQTAEVRRRLQIMVSPHLHGERYTAGEKKRPSRLPIAQARPACSPRGVALYQVDPPHIKFSLIVLHETLLTMGWGDYRRT